MNTEHKKLLEALDGWDEFVTLPDDLSKYDNDPNIKTVGDMIEANKRATHQPENTMTPQREHELAEPLANFINPEHKDFDLMFTIEILLTRPDWLTNEEKDKVVKVIQKKNLKRCLKNAKKRRNHGETNEN